MIAVPMPSHASARAALVSLLLAALAGIGAARAHDFTILPATSRPAPDVEFALGMWVGAVFPGEPVPWRTGHVTEMAIVDARGRRDIETPELDGQPPRARLRLRAPGTAIVALATDPSYITIEAPEFTPRTSRRRGTRPPSPRAATARGAPRRGRSVTPGMSRRCSTAAARAPRWR